MTPLFLTGFFKSISEIDYPMQIYCGYIIELCTLSLPILILQGVNNTMLNKWETDKTNTMISAAILLVNLVIDMRGIIYIGDKMNKESNDRERR
jgi:hypothetical protein